MPLSCYVIPLYGVSYRIWIKLVVGITVGLLKMPINVIVTLSSHRLHCNVCKLRNHLFAFSQCLHILSTGFCPPSLSAFTCFPLSPPNIQQFFIFLKIILRLYDTPNREEFSKTIVCILSIHKKGQLNSDPQLYIHKYIQWYIYALVVERLVQTA